MAVFITKHFSRWGNRLAPAAVTTCDNRFLSNQLLAAGKDCGAVAWSALPFLCWLKLGIFWWVVLTPQSSVAVSSCVNEALKTLDLYGFLGYIVNSLKSILYD
jgi:hypothetical protein